MIAAAAMFALIQVTTAQNDNARTGADTRETILSPSSVNARRFGRLFSLRVDGDVYAQPLYIPRVRIAGGVHDVLVVATEHDSVYAFDAKGVAAKPLWHVRFADEARGTTPVPFRDVRCPFIRPEIGITATPVIDTARGVIYVLARAKEVAGNGSKYVQKLHAIDLTTGAEEPASPVEITASVRGTGAGSSGGSIAFDPLRENPRAALLLANGNVYASWASSCDVGPYHGWILSFDAHSLRQNGVYNASPNGSDAGVWQGDAGLAADKQGNIYAATGNGTFDAVSGGSDYGDSIVQLSPKLSVLQYFTPHDQRALDANDLDVGSGGPVLLPGNAGNDPALIVTGKSGTIFAVNRARFGGYNLRTDAAQRIYSEKDGYSGFAAPAYWNGSLYVLLSDDVLKRFTFVNGKLRTVPEAHGSHRFSDPGATPAISANGNENGIVWVIETKSWNGEDRPAILRAYDAQSLGELYNSEQVSKRDRAGMCLRFTVPTIAEGRVYVDAKGEVDVYGLLPHPAG